MQSSIPMASLARPTKRQRRDHGVEISTNPTVPGVIECRGSTSLLQQVERLVQTNAICSDNLIEILGQIRANTNFIESNSLQESLALRKLHGTLILHIGFLLGSLKEASESNEKSEEVLSALILCLWDLHTSKKETLQEFITGEELSELFVLVPDVICSIFPDMSGKRNISETTVRQEIKKGCHDILLSWLSVPILLEHVISKGTIPELENFILALLKSNNPNAMPNTNEKAKVNEILEQLRALCDNHSEFRKLLDVAQLVCAGSHASSSLDGLSPRLTIFYWRCVSCVLVDIGVIDADRATDSLMPYGISNDFLLSRLAMSCMSEFIPSSSQDRHRRLLTFASKALLDRDVDSKETNLSSMLQCLCLCMKLSSSIDFFLQQKSWENVFDSLVFLAEDEEDSNVAEKASMVIIPILKRLVISDEHRSSLPFDQSLEILIFLLSLHHTSIVGSTIELLFVALQNSKTRRIMESSTLLPDLVNALGDLSSKNFFVDENLKAQLAQAFSILIEKIRNVNFLAKKASNLTFLVRLANGSYFETDQSRVQEISICTIMKLAKNPCNQRILAKEPGLLSTLIRYTRMTPENTAVLSESRISRKEMKDRILLVANAL